jgi:signal peptidase I
MTETLLELDDFDDVAAELRALAQQAAPVVKARPDLARVVLRRHKRRRLAKRGGAALIGLALVGGVAAGARSGHHGYFARTQPSAAMQPTVMTGQTVVFSKKLIPERGDVVLARVKFGSGTVEVLKRVVALPGDTVGCPAGASGRCAAVVVDGVPLRETYLGGRATDPFPTVTVPAGEAFLLGDNRPDSADSRNYGPVPLDRLIGVAVRIEDAGGAAHSVPGAPSHPGPPDDGVQDFPPPVPPALVQTP